MLRYICPRKSEFPTSERDVSTGMRPKAGFLKLEQFGQIGNPPLQINASSVLGAAAVQLQVKIKTDQTEPTVPAENTGTWTCQMRRSPAAAELVG